ncbi:MAG: hypothetical protein LIO37_03930 [Clostridiales bacterium]|nr:hypothetical protein [Clostridiales bacterium]
MRNRRIAFACILLVGITILSGCGSSYGADSSTVFILKSGKVVSVDVEDFEEDTYNITDLQAYVEAELENYTSVNGGSSVKLSDLTVDNDVAALTIEYASIDDYEAFNGIFLYSGTVIQALRDGYTFDVSFKRASDGREVSVSEVLDSEKLNLVIIQANTTVTVPGEIVYYSYDGEAVLTSEDTLAIGQGLSDSSDTEDETADPVGTEDVSAETESTEDVTTSGSVSDEEMLTGDSETEEVTFDFDAYEEENPEVTSEASLYTDIYTYIIYK